MSTNHKNTNKNKLGKEFYSGFIAGSITSFIVHPLDLIKLRLQLNATNTTPTQNSWLSTIRSVSNTSNLYRGVSINVLGNSIAWALYFGLYRTIKDQLTSVSRVQEGPLLYLTSGALAGMSTSILTNPIWVLKTRIMSLNKSSPNNLYLNIPTSVKNVIRQDGWRVWKIGIKPAILGVSQGAIYFMIYDTLKTYQLTKQQQQPTSERGKLSTKEIIALTSLSKMVSTSVVYPLQLIKSNQQSIKAINIKDYQSVTLLISQIIRRNGFTGLYKGLSTNLLKAIPSTCLTFYIYETINNL